MMSGTLSLTSGPGRSASPFLIRSGQLPPVWPGPRSRRPTGHHRPHEADAELVGGYDIGGGRFTTYFAAECLNVLIVSRPHGDAVPGRLVAALSPTWSTPIVSCSCEGDRPVLAVLHLGAHDAATACTTTTSCIPVEILSAGRPQCPVDRDPHGPVPSKEPSQRCAVTISAAPPRWHGRAPAPAFGETLRRGLKTTFAALVEGPSDNPVPRGEDTHVSPPLPPAPASSMASRTTGLEKCVGCSLCAAACPGRLHPRRGRREHAREPRVARPAPAVYEESTSRAASSPAAARSRARSTRSPWATTTRCRDTDLIFTKEMLLAEPLDQTPHSGRRASSFRHRVWLRSRSSSPR